MTLAPRMTFGFFLASFAGLGLVACARAAQEKPPQPIVCPLLHLPQCRDGQGALDADSVDQWGPGLIEEHVTVRGTFRLGPYECDELLGDGMFKDDCRKDRREEYDLYLGPIWIRSRPLCPCSRQVQIPNCPVPTVTDDIIATGTYSYMPDTGYEGHPAAKHVLKVDKSCRVPSDASHK